MEYTRVYNYDPATGILTRKPRPRSDFSTDARHKEHLRHTGKPVGAYVKRRNGSPIAMFINTKKQGGTDTLVHRIIWKIVYGEIPDGFNIDHINGNPWDNRLENLRLVTHSQNMHNARRHSGKGHGVKGVSWDRHNQMWQTEIRTDRGRLFLGRHKTKGMAALTYAKASLRYHGPHSLYARKRAVPQLQFAVPEEDLARMREKGLL